jgi:hypothetical protein
MSHSYRDAIDRVLTPHPRAVRDPLLTLFTLAFNQLKAAERGNPLVHHVVVLDHALLIAKGESLDRLTIGAIAILHDISAVEKVRVADVRMGGAELAAATEQRRHQHRSLHMREGAALAQRVLLNLNEYYGRIVFTDDMIARVVEVIAIHDNPTIGLPIPGPDMKDRETGRMAIAFREADRLWMLSQSGFAVDMDRDRKHPDNAHKLERELAWERLAHVLDRYGEERLLYGDDAGSHFGGRFFGGTFIRTTSGASLFDHYVTERRQEYQIEDSRSEPPGGGLPA